MAYKPQLRVQVEWEGATFEFISPDRAMGEVVRAMTVSGMVDLVPGAIPSDIIPLLPDVFEEGCVAWSGVEDADGKALRCDRETKRAIPFIDKVQIASKYMEALEELQAGKEPPPAPPTN